MQPMDWQAIVQAWDVDLKHVEPYRPKSDLLYCAEQKRDRPALILTLLEKHRERVIYLDGQKPKVRWTGDKKLPLPGYFNEAAFQTPGADLYVLNGEKSVLNAQTNGIENAFCLTCAEGKSAAIQAAVTHIVERTHKRRIFIPADCDAPGIVNAYYWHKWGSAAGLEVIPLDLGQWVKRVYPDDFTKGYDTRDLSQSIADPDVFRFTLENLPILDFADYADDLPIERPPRQERHYTPRSVHKGQSIDWIAVYENWWNQELIPALERKSPSSKGIHKHRHCPDKNHTDHDASFRIQESGAPVCTCNRYTGDGAKDRLAEDVGAVSWEQYKAKLIAAERQKSDGAALEGMAQEPYPDQEPVQPVVMNALPAALRNEMLKSTIIHCPTCEKPRLHKGKVNNEHAFCSAVCRQHYRDLHGFKDNEPLNRIEKVSCSVCNQDMALDRAGERFCTDDCKYNYMGKDRFKKLPRPKVTRHRVKVKIVRLTAYTRLIDQMLMAGYQGKSWSITEGENNTNVSRSGINRVIGLNVHFGNLNIKESISFQNEHLNADRPGKPEAYYMLPSITALERVFGAPIGAKSEPLPQDAFETRSDHPAGYNASYKAHALLTTFPHEITVISSHKDLADRIGISPSTVSKYAKLLKEDGWLDYWREIKKTPLDDSDIPNLPYERLEADGFRYIEMYIDPDYKIPYEHNGGNNRIPCKRSPALHFFYKSQKGDESPVYLLACNPGVNAFRRIDKNYQYQIKVLPGEPSLSFAPAWAAGGD